MKHVTLAVLVGTAVLSFTPVESFAQSTPSVNSKTPGYVVDRNGNPVKMGRTGDCVRLTRQWSQAIETPECRNASLKAAQPAGKRYSRSEVSLRAGRVDKNPPGQELEMPLSAAFFLPRVPWGSRKPRNHCGARMKETRRT